jgi:hypothetical protein
MVMAEELNASQKYNEEATSESGTHGYEKMRKLRGAMDWSRRKLLPFRRNRLNAIREYVGAHYSDHGSKDKVPVNLLEMAVNIYTRQLAAHTPRVMCSTKVKKLRSECMTFELAINQLLDEIKFKKTISKAVLNAFFGMGIVKKGMTFGEQIEMNGFTHDIGQPFADNVDLDDWVHDMTGKQWDQLSYMGNRYRLPYELVMDSNDFINKDHLKPTSKSGNASQNASGDDRAQNITSEYDLGPEEYMEFVELWDIWLPYENRIITMPFEGGGQSDPAIRAVDYDGPENGPYSILAFTEVPSNLMPLSPVALLMDMHDLSNRIFRKLGRQAERQKTVLGVAGGAMDDGERIRDADDGQIIRMDHPGKSQEFNFGGVDQVNLAFFLQLRDLFSYFGGNLDSIGGLGAQSQTVGQDKMLSEAASQKVSDMQDKTYDFSKEIVRDLGWYLWHDPMIDMPLIKRVPGISIDIPVRFSAEEREGDFYDHNIQIALHSMQDQTPSEKMRTITEIFNNFVAPYIEQLDSQGMGVDFEGLFKLFAKYTNTPELDDLFTFVTDPERSINTPSEAVGKKPQNTTRTNIRVNRPGTTRQGKDQAIMQSLLTGMGKGQQPGQGASMFRGTE